MDIEWRCGELVKASVCSGYDTKMKFVYKDKVVQIDLEKDKYIDIVF